MPLPKDVKGSGSGGSALVSTQSVAQNRESLPGRPTAHSIVKREIPMIRRLLILTGLATLVACADAGLEPGEGFVDVTGGQVWYRISGSGTGTPLILLHGGPGATGTLKTFERAEALAGTAVPILFTTGRYDEATPETVDYYASRAPDARVVILENSAHLTMQDEPERNVEVVRDFLRDVEARS